MDISIVGATGDVGRQVATTIVHERLLEKSDRLQLVGREQSAPRLFGLADDLREAYDETAPQIDIAFYPEDIVADIVVMVAGVTVEPGQKKPMTRDDVAIANAPLLRSTARAIAKHGHGSELAVIITNPVELGVEIFSEEWGDRHRVVGMGSFIDSLRFRAELAADLFVRRHQVSGFCIGEHGSAILPLWSSIRVAGMEPEELDERLNRIRRGQPLKQFPERLAKNLKVCLGMIGRQEYGPVYEFVESLSPEYRCVLRPYLTQMSGAKTVAATARSAYEFLQTIVEGREQVLAGQMMLDGEFYGLRGPCGVPLIMGHGIRQVVQIPLWEEEVALLRRANREINAKTARWKEAADGVPVSKSS
ncbi:lactate dehydrogenase [bacterium]|nr:lactate dehydrogenase [bacterium]